MVLNHKQTILKYGSEGQAKNKTNTMDMKFLERMKEKIKRLGMRHSERKCEFADTLRKFSGLGMLNNGHKHNTEDSSRTTVNMQ
jgi:hypothetical protein